MRLPTLPIRQHGLLTTDDPREVLAAASIGPGGEAVALWSTADDLAALTSYTTQPGWASFPDPRTPRPVAARISVHRTSVVETVRIAQLPLAHPTVQPLPDGHMLIVAARCRWHPDGPDRNAIVYDNDGQVVGEHTLGDGIEHVLVDSSGYLWVGYFDEGVYGNYGWGDAGAPRPIGNAGLVRFTPALEADWRFPGGGDEPWGAISDCYALNIDEDTAWTCYYTDFPVVRVRNGELTGWRNTTGASARALAVSGTTVGLCGGSAAEHDRLVLAALDHDELHEIAEYRLVLPDGAPIPATAQLFGRGAHLHLITDGQWHRLDLDRIPAT